MSGITTIKKKCAPCLHVEHHPTVSHGRVPISKQVRMQKHASGMGAGVSSPSKPGISAQHTGWPWRRGARRCTWWLNSIYTRTSKSDLHPTRSDCLDSPSNEALSTKKATDSTTSTLLVVAERLNLLLCVVFSGCILQELRKKSPQNSLHTHEVHTHTRSETPSGQSCAA